MALARPKKQQRLLLAALALVALVAAALVAMFALRDTAAYFKAPADLVADRPAPGQTFRLGGLVKAGTLERAADGITLQFVVTDNQAETPVSYRGLTPDLFGEGQGVIATGSFDSSGRFQAEQLLAKHDENYVPPEVEKALEKSGAHAKTVKASDL